MVDLPVDLKLMVLDHIKRPSDLKSLCLTSKAWRSAAVSRLYSEIVLDLHKHEAIPRFMRCIAAGAGQHFSATRALTLYDSDRPAESDMSRNTSVPCTHIPLGLTPHPGKTEIAYAISLILLLLPKDNLQVFRFPSEEGLQGSCLMILLETQHKLRHLTANLHHTDVTCLMHNAWIGLLHPGLQTLDIQFNHFDRYGTVLEFILRRCQNLERLHLGLDNIADNNGTALKEQWNKKIAEDRHFPKNNLPKLKALSLGGFDLEGMSHLIAGLATFSKLTSLSLRGCAHADDFLSELGSAFKNKTIAMEHLALQESSRSTSEKSLDDSLADIYRSCKKLTSLHLTQRSSYQHEFAHTTFKKLPRLGRGLRALSLHINYDIEDDMSELPDYRDLSADMFKTMCKSCPNLQQLGIHYDEDIVHDGTWLRNSEAQYLEPLGDLSELRILHLRQHRVAETERAGGISLRLQRSANEFFNFLDKRAICPKLKVLIIGTYGEEPHVWIEELSEVCQHAFVKQAVFGGRMTIAVPVSRLELLEMEPDLEVLDFDPQADWIGRLPGRFHD